MDNDSPVCDSYVRPETLVRICDECNFGTYGGRCIICGSPGEPPPRDYSSRLFFSFSDTRVLFPGISDAYYCAECTRLEKDRDGCPKIVNLGASRTDLFYERRRLGEFFLLLSFCGRALTTLRCRVQEGLESYHFSYVVFLLHCWYIPQFRQCDDSCWHNKITSSTHTHIATVTA